MDLNGNKQHSLYLNITLTVVSSMCQQLSSEYSESLCMDREQLKSLHHSTLIVITLVHFQLFTYQLIMKLSCIGVVLLPRNNSYIANNINLIRLYWLTALVEFCIDSIFKLIQFSTQVYTESKDVGTSKNHSVKIIFIVLTTAASGYCQHVIIIKNYLLKRKGKGRKLWFVLINSGSRVT